MSLIQALLMRKKLEKSAKHKDIKQPHKKSTDTLIKLLLSEPLLYRKDINIIAKNISIREPSNKSTNYLINAIGKYEISKKLQELNLNNIKKRHKIKKILVVS